MKKVIVILLFTIMCCFLFAGCDTEETIEMNPEDTARFQYIGKSELTQNGATSNYDTADEIQYYVDNETSIVYVVMVDRAGYSTWAGFTPLIDSDGTYTTSDEFNKK